MESPRDNITFEDIGIKKAPKLADTHLGKVIYSYKHISLYLLYLSTISAPEESPFKHIVDGFTGS